MADVQEDYTTDICLLQTAMKLSMDEAVVTVIIGVSVGVMKAYREQTGYDPLTATNEEGDEALKQVALATTELVNEKLDGKETVDVARTLDVLATFSEAVDENKKD